MSDTPHGAASSLAKSGLLEQGQLITVTVSTDERPVFEVNSRFEHLVCRVKTLEPAAQGMTVAVTVLLDGQQWLFPGGSR